MRRYDELDSLRGLAALSVLIGHCLTMLPYLTIKEYNSELWGWNIFKYTPLSIVWAGHEAVILFFLLSGFVLSLPYNHGKQLPYPTYLIRRICRIYVPYLVALVLAIIARSYFSTQQLTGFSDWFSALWRNELSFQTVINHLLFLGNYDTRELNTVVWSLIEELRISIIFPLIVLVVLRLNWKINIAIALFSSLISYSGLYIKWHSSSSIFINLAEYLGTFEWIPMFIVGAILAKNSVKLIKFYRTFSKSMKVTFLIIGIMFYTYSHWMPFGGKLFHLTIIEDWIILIGASMFIISALASSFVSKVLLIKPIHFIGKISYSIYLYHLIILLSLTNLLVGHVSLVLIWLLTVVLTIVFSSVSYFFVELPSIQLGRYLTKGILRRENTVTT